MSSALSRFSSSPALWVALASCLTVACGDNQDEGGARNLLASAREQNYRTWDRAPGWPGRTQSNAPHGGAVDIYVNTTVADALAVGEPLAAWPLGSVIAKDGWDGSDLELIALMEKRADGWFYAEFDADGDPSYSGHPDVCIDCHARGSDYVRAFRLP
jgi:hypothetical protein